MICTYTKTKFYSSIKSLCWPVYWAITMPTLAFDCTNFWTYQIKQCHNSSSSWMQARRLSFSFHQSISASRMYCGCKRRKRIGVSICFNKAHFPFISAVHKYKLIFKVYTIFDACSACLSWHLKRLNKEYTLMSLYGRQPNDNFHFSCMVELIEHSRVCILCSYWIQQTLVLQFIRFRIRC